MIIRVLILFIPALLASVLPFDNSDLLYWVSWLGGGWVYFYTLSGHFNTYSDGMKLHEALLRPQVITFIIFGGYMSVSSVFFYLENSGYYYLQKDSAAYTDEKTLALTATAQFYYLWALTSYACGLFINLNYSAPKYTFTEHSVSQLSFKLSIYFLVAALVTRFIPGLQIVALFVGNLSLVASVVSLAYSLPERKLLNTSIAGFIFASNYINALTSGWKEAIIVPVVLLGAFFYNSYRKLTVVGGVVFLSFYFYSVPTYNNIVRGLSWGGEMDGREAANIAIEMIQKGEVDIAQSNWDFLTDRFSEIGMFVKYIENVPAYREYYGFEIIQNTLVAIIPRLFFPEKGITEELVSQRVIENGVVSELSKVSAKPAFIVDCYLSFGMWGVITLPFLLGYYLCWVSRKAENLFGGYVLGSGLIFTGLFQGAWRGNCFEFFGNYLFWGLIIMYAIFYAFKINNNIAAHEVKS